jgi:hypothetical protein
MPDIPLQVLLKSFTTDRGLAVQSLRPSVRIEIEKLQPHCFFDSGAPFSIITWPLSQMVRWRLLGTSLSSQGVVTSLDWYGISCRFGETEIVLRDVNGLSSWGPYLLRGKFAQARHPMLGFHVVLGMNFLADNGVDFELRNTATGLTGVFSVP